MVCLERLDGTPVFDIKPYLPYCEAPPGARGGFAGTQPESLEVVIDETVADAFGKLGLESGFLKVASPLPQKCFKRSRVGVADRGWKAGDASA